MYKYCYSNLCHLFKGSETLLNVPYFSYQQALDQSNLTFLVDRRISICNKLMANMRNEDHPISFLAPQAMTRFIPFQLRSGNTRAITSVKRTKRANDFFTSRYS